MKCGFLVITGVGHLAGEDNGVDWPAGSSSLKLVARPVAGEMVLRAPYLSKLVD